jgi:hypothetical protein
MNAKLCTICQTRPISSKANRVAAGMSSDMKYCLPCFDEAGWENSHADGHSESSKVEGCWICYPELNKAQREYTPREGTSRAGMVINVTIRAAGVDKANEVLAKLDESYETTKITKPSKRNAQITKLAFASTVQAFELRWDDRGRFIGGTVTEDGRSKKIRNVAEALRLSR